MKALLALESCNVPKYVERRELIESTWAKRMPAGFEFQVFTGPCLGVGDGYHDLCAKTRAICRYAALHEFGSLAIVDDDTFLRTDRLAVPAVDYGGYILPKDPKQSEPYCTGSFYWLSRRAFTILADSPLDPEWTNQEDQWVGWTLRRHGILPTKLPEVVLQPCPCGLPQCVPDVVPSEWTAYMISMRYKREIFLDFERLYSAHL